MGAKRKQAIHCTKMAQNRKVLHNEKPPDVTEKIDPDLMVISGLLSGNGYEGTKHIANRLNKLTPSKKTYYDHQPKVLKAVNEIVSTDCNKYAKQIKRNTALSCDCSWNHKHCGSAGTVTVYDNKQKKFVGCETLTKSKGKFEGNYNGNSNNMETNGLERVFDKIGDSISNKNITFSHDHCNQTHQFLKRHDSMNIKETLDPGHATQELKRSANNYFEQCARELKDKKNDERKTIKKCFEIFSTLITKLIVWFKVLVSCVHSEEKKEKLWKNTSKHVVGNHADCCHPFDITDQRGPGRPRKRKGENDDYWVWEEAVKDNSLVTKLDGFLNKTTDLVKQTGVCRTQDNESVNANIRRFMPKNKVFSASSEARASIAIGMKNDIHFESNLIQKICPNSISSNVLNEIRKDEIQRDSRNTLKRTPNQKYKKNISRLKLREKNNEPPGDYKSQS